MVCINKQEAPQERVKNFLLSWSCATNARIYWLSHHRVELTEIDGKIDTTIPENVQKDHDAHCKAPTHIITVAKISARLF